MESREIIKLSDDYIMNTYARFPVAIQRGEGTVVFDFEGKRYLDFTSGIGVCSIGHAHPLWAAAVETQCRTLGHISNLFYSEPGARLAERLARLSGLDRVFFSNSGAEANEGAIKLARKYSFDKYGPGRHTVLTLNKSFHGRTVTTLAATGQEHFHNYFFPFTEGFRHVEAGDTAELLSEAGKGDVCAVMLEPVQGEGGVYPMDETYVREVYELCLERDLLLICDEVQTGIGRTGSLFAFMHYGIKPDIVTFAKGIASGLPLGGFLAGARCFGTLTPGTHATTFGANPVCCAAALSVLDVLEGGVMDQVEEKGLYLRRGLEALPGGIISGTRGAGLMIGAVLEGRKPRECAEKLISSGLLCLTAGSDALRFLPPLNVSYDELDEALEIIRASLL